MVKSKNKVKIILLSIFLIISVLMFSVITVLAATNAGVNSDIGIIYEVTKSTLKSGHLFNSLIPSDCEDMIFGKTSEYSEILQDATNNPENYTITNVEKENKDTIKMYYNSTTKKAYVLSRKTIYFNSSSLLMFNGKKLNSIIFDNINTSQVTSMDYMFSGVNVSNLDLSMFDTSNVNSMMAMFEGSYINSINLQSFNTSKVTSMQQMFNWCNSLTKVYVGENWDISSVTNSERMFADCTNILGGNGTVYDSTKTDIEYARVDVPGTPGYLTLKTN